MAKSVKENNMDIGGVAWFNVSPGFFKIGKSRNIKLWNLHVRDSTDGFWWGVGILQYGNRHLLFVGSAGVSVFFIGKTR